MIELRKNTVAEDDYTPEDAGWDARLECTRLSDNPYAINNWKYYEWEKGWKLADDTVVDAPDLPVS